MYLFLWILLGLLGLGILFFHIRAYKFNKINRNLIIASFQKDIWPYRLLWGIRFVLFLILLFFKGINIGGNISNRYDNIKESVVDVNDKDKSDKKSDKKDSDNIHHGFISEQEAFELGDKKDVTLIPITDGYYEVITNDQSVIHNFINTKDFRIPEPIEVNSCDINYAYRNLWGNYLNYNGFLYEYINSHKQKNPLIAILDTGIDDDNSTLQGHKAINSNETLDGKDTDNNGYIDDIAGVNIVSNNGDTNDENGHGTHIAGIVLQTYPNALLLPIKLTEGTNENINELDIIKGLRYAIDANADIINMSFAGEGFNEVTDALIKEATDKGIIVIASAGNESEDVSIYYPANYTGVINVGSVGQTGISIFSNIDTDTLFPGECIRSFGLDGNKVFWGGTSMSAPHLVGMLGTYISLGNDLNTKSEALSILSKNSKTTNGYKLTDAPKLYGISKDNDNAYSYIGSIEFSLKSIQTKLGKLQNSVLTEQGLNNVASYKSTLSKAATNIGNLYSKLSMNTGFGLELKKDIEEYNELLGQLSMGGLYLEVEGGILKNSLGVRICSSDYDTVCNEFSKIIYGGASLPANGNSSYITVGDYQTSLEFDIFQGENSIATSNTKLGTVKISGLPSRLKGNAGAIVYFSVDGKGKLSVRAVDQDNVNNAVSATIDSVKRDVVVVTGENYYKAQNVIKELLQKTDEILPKIQKFYNLNPFDYVPESVTGYYTISGINEIDIESIPVYTGDNNTSYDVLENVKVEEVVDGDTIKVTLNGKSEKVRLIGVDAPESYKTRYGYVECFGDSSSKYLSNLLTNKSIGLLYDETQDRYDTYGRLLAYVIFNGENVNQKIIENGYGWEYTYKIPYKYQSEFKQAEIEAKNLGKGLWNKTTCNGQHKGI